MSSGRAYLDQQERYSLLRPIKPGGADQEKAPVRDIGMRVPNLLPGADEIVLIVLGTHLKGRPVGSGAGFRITLAPEVLTAQQAGKKMRLLLCGAVPHDRGAAHLDPHGRNRRRTRSDAFAR